MRCGKCRYVHRYMHPCMHAHMVHGDGNEQVQATAHSRASNSVGLPACLPACLTQGSNWVGCTGTPPLLLPARTFIATPECCAVDESQPVSQSFIGRVGPSRRGVEVEGRASIHAATHPPIHPPVAAVARGAFSFPAHVGPCACACDCVGAGGRRSGLGNAPPSLVQSAGKDSLTALALALAPGPPAAFPCP